MTTPDPDIAAIAGELSDVQRRALVRGQCGINSENSSCLCDFPQKAILWELGLVERKGDTAIWRTPLGLAVRDHLLRSGR